MSRQRVSQAGLVCFLSSLTPLHSRLLQASSYRWNSPQAQVASASVRFATLTYPQSTPPPAYPRLLSSHLHAPARYLAPLTARVLSPPLLPSLHRSSSHPLLRVPGITMPTWSRIASRLRGSSSHRSLFLPRFASQRLTARPWARFAYSCSETRIRVLRLLLRACSSKTTWTSLT
jgi:hypothetical protein